MKKIHRKILKGLLIGIIIAVFEACIHNPPDMNKPVALANVRQLNIF